MIGNLDPNIVELPMLGRCATRATLSTDVLGRKVGIKIYRNEDDINPLIAKDTLGTEVVVLTGDRTIFFELTDIEKAFLSPTRVYHLHIFVYSAANAVEHNQSYHLLPLLQFINVGDIIANAAMDLSTRYKNVRTLLGAAGGAGFLDGIVTVGQPVGAIVSFVVAATGTQEEHILETRTDQAGDGFTVPNDWNAVTNNKIWRKI